MIHEKVPIKILIQSLNADNYHNIKLSTDHIDKLFRQSVTSPQWRLI